MIVIDLRNSPIVDLRRKPKKYDRIIFKARCTSNIIDSLSTINIYPAMGINDPVVISEPEEFDFNNKLSKKDLKIAVLILVAVGLVLIIGILLAGIIDGLILNN